MIQLFTELMNATSDFLLTEPISYFTGAFVLLVIISLVKKII